MASSMLGGGGGSSMLEQAVGAIRSFGATDSLVSQLYQSNPRVREIIDQNRGKSIDDLLRGVGVDPAEARRLLGISRR